MFNFKIYEYKSKLLVGYITDENTYNVDWLLISIGYEYSSWVKEYV